MLQSEALRVHGVLLHACGRYFFHHAKLFCAPHLLPDAASPAERDASDDGTDGVDAYEEKRLKRMRCATRPTPPSLSAPSPPSLSFPQLS